MTLRQLIDTLATLDNGLTICAAKAPEWGPDSEAELCPSADVPKKAKHPYFLEVAIAKDVLRAWSFAREGKTPNLEQKCEAIIYYAENDAYLLPDEA